MNPSVKLLQEMWFGESLLLHITSRHKIICHVAWPQKLSSWEVKQSSLETICLTRIYYFSLFTATQFFWPVTFADVLSPLNVFMCTEGGRGSHFPLEWTLFGTVFVFSLFFPQMFTLACEIEWLRQPALHQCTYTAFTVNVINELWPQTLQTAKLTQTLPITGQILRSPKQWPKSLVITTELSEFIYFYFIFFRYMSTRVVLMVWRGGVASL